MPCPQSAPSPSTPFYRTTTVRQPSTVTLLTLMTFMALLIGTLLAQPTDAFLLSHRNLLAPFASTRMAHANTGAVAAVEPAQAAIQPVQAPPADDDGEEEEAEGSEAEQLHRHLHLAGYLLVPAGADLQELQSAVADLLPDELQNAAPAEVIQNAGADLQEPLLRQVAKRMHHLSILRKIGAPGTSSAASRLFGPQRQRELKRRAPLWVINY